MSEVVLDQAGRVEIPESIRTQFGLMPGSKLEIDTGLQGVIYLWPVSEESDGEQSGAVRLIRKNGVLVASVEPVGDLEHAVSSLEPETELIEPELIEENGILVLQAGAGLDINKLIEEDREERMNKLMEGIRF